MAVRLTVAHLAVNHTRRQQIFNRTSRCHFAAENASFFTTAADVGAHALTFAAHATHALISNKVTAISSLFRAFLFVGDVFQVLLITRYAQVLRPEKCHQCLKIVAIIILYDVCTE